MHIHLNISIHKGNLYYKHLYLQYTSFTFLKTVQQNKTRVKMIKKNNNTCFERPLCHKMLDVHFSFARLQSHTRFACHRKMSHVILVIAEFLLRRKPFPSS
jgi:hypothetical protein